MWRSGAVKRASSTLAGSSFFKVRAGGRDGAGVGARELG
jgi:hypothetical protein